MAVQAFAHFALVLAVEGGAQQPAFIVLDFDAGELVHEAGEASDPDRRTTPFSNCAGVWPPLRDPDRELQILEHVAELFADFDAVVVADDPPCEGPYVRVVVGPYEGCGPGKGYAERECDRNLGHGMVYAMLAEDDGYDARRASVLVAHEVGHAFGLAHVDDPADIMHPTTGMGDKTFVDRCNPFPEFDSTCALVGACPTLEPVGQNSHFGLMTLLGPARTEGFTGCDGEATEDHDDPTEGPNEDPSEAPIAAERDADGCTCSASGSSSLVGLLACVLIGSARSRRRSPRG